MVSRCHKVNSWMMIMHGSTTHRTTIMVEEGPTTWTVTICLATITTCRAQETIAFKSMLRRIKEGLRGVSITISWMIARICMVVHHRSSRQPSLCSIINHIPVDAMINLLIHLSSLILIRAHDPDAQVIVACQSLSPSCRNKGSATAHMRVREDIIIQRNLRRKTHLPQCNRLH